MLIGGAQALVHGAAQLVSGLGISLLTIGLTVAASGTNVPETAASGRAALTGQAAITLGNMVRVRWVVEGATA